uniref:Uncharacterized protein n=1 Tax=Lactuca sativa TaxID=4236 RepID=A0A9R1VUZ4_LACSA|nr:hypothetical protein LSAT_V11C400197710 [Lactuca sativa]
MPINNLKHFSPLTTTVVVVASPTTVGEAVLQTIETIEDLLGLLIRTLSMGHEIGVTLSTFHPITLIVTLPPSGTDSHLHLIMPIIAHTHKLLGFLIPALTIICLDPTTDRIYIALHIRFVEQQFPFLQPLPIPPTTPSPDPYISSYPTIIPPSDNPIDTATPPTPPIILTETPSTSSLSSAPEPSTRVQPSHLRQNPKQQIPYDPYAYSTSRNYSDIEPTTVAIANKSPKWQAAMAEEYFDNPKIFHSL